MRWSYVGSGRNADVFRVRRGRHSTLVKVTHYRASTICKFSSLTKEGKTTEARAAKARDSVAVASAMGAIGNSFVRRRISPHFPLWYGSVDCKDFFDKIRHAVARRRVASRYANLAFVQPYDCDMTTYVLQKRPGDAVLRVLCFQVLYTLAALQHRFPGFRHNDLSTNNVLVKTGRVRAAAYRVGDATYCTDSPAMAAVSDFEFVHIPGTLENDRVTSGRIRVLDASRNDAYDAHFFLKSVLRCLRSARYGGARETLAFLHGLRLTKDRLTKDHRRFHPRTLLGDAYFSPLRRCAETRTSSPRLAFAFE